MKLIYKSIGFWVAALVCMLYFNSKTATAVEMEVGDEAGSIMSQDTSKSDETPNQIEGVCQIPEGFGLNAYIELQDADGIHYYVCVSQENGYADRLYVQNGTYNFVSAGVFGDYTGQYKFDLVEGDGEFELDGESNSFFCVKVKISDYDQISEEINEKQGIETQKSLDVGKTSIDGVTIDSTGELYYRTDNKSDKGTLEIFGNAANDYDVYAEIIESGVVGEAKFKLSLDGGKTFIGEDITSDEFDLGSYGIKMKFKTAADTDELSVGDVFTAHIPATYYISQLNPTENNLIISGIAKQDSQLKVDILSTETMGKAKFSVSFDGGNSVSITDTVPVNGVYQMGDLTLYFYTIDKFSKGDTYTAFIKSNYEEPSYIGYIVLAAICTALLISGVAYLLLHVEKNSDYTVQVWKDMQDREAYR